jgi:YegS/Rv2252/BmrU family lipid kinase
MTAARRYYLIINPAAGVIKDPSLEARLVEAFEGAGCRVSVVRTKYGGHARELAQSVPLHDHDGLCALGGDGTLHELLNGLLSRKDGLRLPVGLIPGGTGNALLREFGCLEPFEAVQRIVQQRPRAVDVLRVESNGRMTFAFNIVGWGILAAANEQAERLRWIGRRRYDVAALLEIIRLRRFQGRLRFDEQTVHGPFNAVFGCNTKFTGTGMKIAPQAVLDDGLVDLMWVQGASRFGLLGLFRRLFSGNHLHSAELERARVQEFTLELQDYPYVNIDGECVEADSLRVVVMPAAVEVLV